MSDHRQICSALRRDRPNSKRIRNRKNTNWTVYKQEVEGKVGMWFGTINNPTDIETELIKVSSAIIRSFEKACPERKIGKRNRVPWWNRELNILRQKANKAFHLFFSVCTFCTNGYNNNNNKAYKTRESKDWELHKEARRAFKKLLRRNKRESWYSFCSHIETIHVQVTRQRLFNPSRYVTSPKW